MFVAAGVILGRVRLGVCFLIYLQGHAFLGKDNILSRPRESLASASSKVQASSPIGGSCFSSMTASTICEATNSLVIFENPTSAAVRVGLAPPAGSWVRHHLKECVYMGRIYKEGHVGGLKRMDEGSLMDLVRTRGETELF